MLTCAHLSAQLIEDVVHEEPPQKNILPALKVLPAGSVLNNVSIPRYTTDYKPASLFTAKTLKIINEQQIVGEQATICLFQPDGKQQTKLDFDHIQFDQLSGVLFSKDNLHFATEQFEIAAQGLILHWKTKSGFLLGKNETIIYTETLRNSTMKATRSATTALPRHIIRSGAALLLSSAISAQTPELDNAIEQAKAAHQAVAKTKKANDKTLDDATRSAQAALDTDAQVIAKARARNQELDKEKAVLAKTTALDKLLPQVTQEELREITPKQGKEHVSISSEGPMLFDANKGILIFSKNVVLRHPKYYFTCSGDVYVQLKKSPSKKDKSANPMGDLRDIKSITARKNVIVKAKDSKGKPVIAVTHYLNYDHTTGNILLNGAGSRITTASGQIKIVKKDGYIKIDRDFNVTAAGQSTNVNVDSIQNP